MKRQLLLRSKDVAYQLDLYGSSLESLRSDVDVLIEEFGKDATLNVSHDEYELNLLVEWQSPETDKELEARRKLQAKQKEKKKKEVKKKEERELATLKRLKKKYESLVSNL